MVEILRIFVRGQPQPQPRPRARLAGRGPKAFVQFYDGKTYDKGHPKSGQPLPWVLWREAVARAVKSQYRAAKIEGPVRLDCDFYFQRPLSLLKAKSPVGRIYHTGAPDLDNLFKLVKDCLTDCEVWADDGQACQIGGDKWYAAKGAPIGVWIVLQTLADDAPTPGLFESEKALRSAASAAPEEDDEPTTIGFPVKDLGKLFEPRPLTEAAKAALLGQMDPNDPVWTRPRFNDTSRPERPAGRPKPLPEPPEKEVPQRPRPPGWVAPTPMVVPALD